MCKRFLDKRRRRRRRLLLIRHMVLKINYDLDRSKVLLLQGYPRFSLRKSRSCWLYERSETWFEDLWDNRFVQGYRNDNWKNDFRMTGETFDKLVQWLAPYMTKQPTLFREPIVIQKRVAIGLWRLVNGDSFRVIAKCFGIGKSTAVAITHEFCTVVSEKAGDFIKFPNTPLDVAKAIENFKEDVNCEFPQAFAAVDGTLIEIEAPDNPNKKDYFARTKRFAINTQGLVGANLEFFHISTGFPGSCHDSRVWNESSVGIRAARGEILNYPEKVIHDVRVKPLILGDGGYPLATYLMKPYKIPNATPSQLKFNKCLSSARVIVERAFGQLKARFRILWKKQGTNIKNLSSVIISCVVMHNFCQHHNDYYVDKDKVLSTIIQEERKAKRKRQRNNVTTLENAGRLLEILKNHIDANT